MDQDTVGKELVKYYQQLAEVEAKVAVTNAKAARVIENIRIAMELGKGKPMPKALFGHTFGATMDVLERRGILVSNRKDLNNNESGFELIAALLDETNLEHTIAVEAVTEAVKEVAVAGYKRPEAKNTSMNYGLPAGAVDLTETVKGN